MKVYVAIILALTLVMVAAGCSSAPVATIAPTQAPAATTAAPTPTPTAAPTATPVITPTAQPTQGDKDFGQIGSALMASESLGGVSIGMTETQLTAALGKPDSKSIPLVYGSDGLDHSYWTYVKIGLVIGMAKDDAKDKEASVCYISADTSCAFATKQGVKIGDTADAVKAAYADAIDPQAGDEGTIVAGSVFGGIQFTIQDGKVTAIFIGASAE
jgi:hypothetical protein